MHLLLQLNCPIPSCDERTLWIFACNTRLCSHQPVAYKAYRGIPLKKPTDSASSPPVDTSEKLQKPNPVEADLDGLEDEFESLLRLRAEKMTKKAHLKNKAKASQQKPVIPQSTESTPSLPTGGWFAGHCIEFDFETSGNVDLSHEMQLLKEYEKVAGKVSEEWEQEKYEKERPRFYTKQFQTFQDECAKFPEQCLRYQRGGKPLFIAKDQVFKNLEKNPSCQHCKGPTLFELQLMPHLLSLFPLDRHVPPIEGGKKFTLFQSMEWGTVILYTCTSNCTQTPIRSDTVAYMIESLHVQAEPD